MLQFFCPFILKIPPFAKIKAGSLLKAFPIIFFAVRGLKYIVKK
jgi:hypothetical protein